MKKFAVLLIDNQIDNIYSLMKALKGNDFEVQTVPNEQEALLILKDQIVDLVLINIHLPDPESFSICHAIKTHADWSVIPVIFIVGIDDLSLVDRIFESEADDYILKPLVSTELLKKSGMLIELKYSRLMARNMNQMLESKVAQRTNELEDSLRKLGQAKKELEILDTAKTDFLNMISHEIRTPLNGILGSLALIDRYNLSDDVNRYLSLLDFSVKRLEKFSNTILEASILRIKGEKALVFKETDLVSILELAINQCLLLFTEKNIVLEFRKEFPNPVFRGDQKYLLKCFSAVLENAFKFSPVGEKVEIAIESEPDGYIKIVISDNGTGFSKVSLDHIFSPLSNLKGHFDQNTGMGLHIAKLIMDAHSGSIKVGNRNPTGAIVEIRIPARL